MAMVSETLLGWYCSLIAKKSYKTNIIIPFAYFGLHGKREKEVSKERGCLSKF